MSLIVGGTSSFRRREFGSLTGSYTPSSQPQQTRVTVANADWAVTLADAKSFIRVSGNYDDNYIALLLAGVSEQVEAYIGLDTYVRTRESYYPRASREILLPYGIHGSVLTVVSEAQDGTTTTLTVGVDYYVHGMTFKSVEFQAATDAQIFVTYESGFAAGACPEAIRAAILQEMSFQYKNRSDVNTPSRLSVNNLSIEARHLLMSYSRYVV